jgi:predicted metal-binding membrane protein
MGDWLLHPRRRVFADALVVAWVIAWALAGWTAGRALNELSAVTDSAEGAGAAIVRTGESIRDVDVPVVGDVFKEPGDKVVEAGEAAQAQAQESATDIRTAAVLFGLAVWLVPSLPLLFAYAPERRHRGRETRALRALLREHAGDPELDQLLAIRAVAHLPYHRLRALGAPHAPDRTLADAELAREGVTRS